MNTTCYILNRALISPILKKTPYELYFERKPNVSHFHIFGCKCFVHNNGKDDLGKFDAKANEALFIEYSSISKAYWVYNKRTLQIKEFIHVIFDESPSSTDRKKNSEEPKEFLKNTMEETIQHDLKEGEVNLDDDDEVHLESLPINRIEEESSH